MQQAESNAAEPPIYWLFPALSRAEWLGTLLILLAFFSLLCASVVTGGLVDRTAVSTSAPAVKSSAPVAPHHH